MRIFSLLLFSTFASFAVQSGSLVDFYKDLHRHPELSFQEARTAKALADELAALNIEVLRGIGGHGLVGVLKNGKGRTILVRTELDALPVKEETGLAHSSKQDGVMHACGHDLHMTAWVGVARYFATHRDQWAGTLLLLGQPAEEKGMGALNMMKDGLFKKVPRPDFALAWHVNPQLPTGTIGYRPGYLMATADSVDITLYGKGGHGALPHLGKNPIVLAAKLVQDLQGIASQDVPATEPVVVTVGSLHAGTKHNVIPESAHLQLTVRTFSPKTRDIVMKAIEKKARAVVATLELPEPKIEFDKEPTPSLYNDPKLVERLLPTLEGVVGKKSLVLVEPMTVAEDFSRYSLDAGIPSAMFLLGTVSEQRQKKSPVSLHSSHYYPDVDLALPVGVDAMVAMVKALFVL